MNKLKLSFSLTIIGLALFISGLTFQVSAKGKAVEKTFSIDLFDQNLRAQLNGKTIGYTYAIYEGEGLKKSGVGGHWLLPNEKMTEDRRLTALSMGKTITAAAFMKALEEYNAKAWMYANIKAMNLDSYIADFLPKDWTLGDNVNKITFKQLLRHEAGLRNAATCSYEGMQKLINEGVQLSNMNNANYENANFCLFRIIIPYMIYPDVVKKLTPQTAPLETGKLYIKYVQQKIFAPIGHADIDVYQPGPGLNRYYDFNNLSDYSDDRPKTDLTPILRAGAGYWRLSAKEFGKFIAKLRNGKIVSSGAFLSMTTHELGMYRSDSTYGIYYNHNGGADDAQADWMIFPNEITAVFMANSNGGLAIDPKTNKPITPQDLVRNAYNASWTAKKIK